MSTPGTLSFATMLAKDLSEVDKSFIILPCDITCWSMCTICPCSASMCLMNITCSSREKGFSKKRLTRSFKVVCSYFRAPTARQRFSAKLFCRYSDWERVCSIHSIFLLSSKRPFLSWETSCSSRRFSTKRNSTFFSRLIILLSSGKQWDDVFRALAFPEVMFFTNGAISSFASTTL